MNDQEIKNEENREVSRPRHKKFNDWWRERSLGEKIILGIGFAILGLAFIALMGLVTMLLWNWLMPDIFGLKTLNYWQAWGVMILSWILFGGFRSNNSSSSSNRTERKRREELRRRMREDADTATGD
jgi:hypothetical protein